MSTLRVSLHGEQIGLLGAAPDGRPAFAYVDTVVATHHVGTPLLSVSLPVRALPHAGSPVALWLAGATPLDDPDPLACMAALGADPPGAAVVTPDHTVEAGDDDAGSLPPLDEASLAFVADDDTGPTRTLLPGARRKVAVVHRPDGTVALPPAGSAVTTSHVVKREADGRRGASVTEAFTQRLASAAGLGAVPTLHRVWGGLPVVVSRRADRRHDGGRWTRVHMETAAQSIGPTEDPPGLADVAAVLRRHSADPHRELAALLRHVTFLAVVADARLGPEHLLVGLEGGVRLGPLVAARALTGLSQPLDTPVGACTDLAALDVGDLLDEAARWQLAPHTAEGVIGAALRRIDDALDEAVRDVPAVDLAVPEAILQRLRRLRIGASLRADRHA